MVCDLEACFILVQLERCLAALEILFITVFGLSKSIVITFFTEQPSFKHKGLKDLVSEMEERQRVRHDLLDAYEASGAVLPGTFGKRLVP